MQKMRVTVHCGDQAPSPPTLCGASPLHSKNGHFANPSPVSEHFNHADHSINDVPLIPLELIRSNGDCVRKEREAHLIDKAMTLEPK